MKPLKLEPDMRKAAVSRIQRYFADELDQSLGSIPAEQLLTFFAAEIGPYYYNQGLSDAQAVMSRLTDSFNDEIYGLEQRQARAR